LWFLGIFTPFWYSATKKSGSTDQSPLQRFYPSYLKTMKNANERQTITNKVEFAAGLPDGICIFRPKIAIWVNFVEKMLVYFMDIWSIYGHLI
jgi:hypothetical protein